MSKMKTITINGKTYSVEDADSVSFEDEQDLSADQQARARANIGAASIDDDAVGPDAWSSQKTSEEMDKRISAAELETIDKLCPTFTESGTVVACEPVEGYPLEVEWQTKNLVVYPYTDTTKTVNGITFTDNADGSITINGTAEANAVFYFRNYKTWDVKREANYTASLHVVSGSYQGGKPSMAVNYYLIGGGAYRGWLWAMPNEPKAAPCPAEMTSICSYVVITTGITCSNLVVRPQLEAGTVATEYEPYAETATITRCGKNLCPHQSSDEVNSAGHIDMYSAFAGNASSGMTLTVSADITRTDTTLTENGTMRSYIYYTDGTRTTGSATYGAEKDGKPHKKVITLTADPAKNISYLRIIPVIKGVGDRADNIQIEIGNTATAYEPYNSGTFAPGDEIPALPGINTLYADNGIVTVTGRLDPSAIIADLYDKINQLQANAVNNA